MTLEGILYSTGDFFSNTHSFDTTFDTTNGTPARNRKLLFIKLALLGNKGMYFIDINQNLAFLTSPLVNFCQLA